MKFLTAASSFSLVTGAIADVTLDYPTLVKRDLTVIMDAVNSVNSAAASIYYTVEGPIGDIDPNPLNALSDRTDTLISTIQHSTALVKKTSDISLPDAMTLQGSVRTLSTTFNQTVEHVTNSKSAILSAFGPSAVQELNDIKTAYTFLSQAMVAKVPFPAQSNLSQMSASITGIIQQGIAAFAATNSTNNSTGTNSTSSNISSASSFSSSSIANSTATGDPRSTAISTTRSGTTTSSSRSSAVTSPAASAATNAVLTGSAGIFALVAAAIVW